MSFKLSLSQSNIDQSNISSKKNIYKRKNIIYIQKLLLSIKENLKKHKALIPKDKKKLIFGLNCLQMNLLENLDTEIFIKYDFVIILCDLLINEEIEENFKVDILQILLSYMSNTKINCKINYKEIKNFFYFYEELVFDKYSKCVRKYYLILEMMFEYIKFDLIFADEFFNKLTHCLFQANIEISDSVFIGSLFVYTTILKKYDITPNFIELRKIISDFVKINHQNMILEERALYSEIVLHCYKGISINEKEKIFDLMNFIKLEYKDEKLSQILRTLKSLNNIFEITKNPQQILKILNFDKFFISVITKYQNNIDIVKKFSSLFLKFTFKLNKNKFEFVHILETIIYYIEYYHKLKEKEIVINLLKCLCNASLVKENASYLVDERIQNLLLKIYYKDDPEFYFIITSLLFNISFIFDKNEINLKNILDFKMTSVLEEIFNLSLEKKYDNIIGGIMDIFVCLINHNYIEFFSLKLISQIKLTINFYYDNQFVIIRFLNIIKELSFSKNEIIRNILKNNFDYIYLYHIHYRNVQNSEINLLVKKIILNLLEINKNELNEKKLLIHGIPENIIHTLSLNDSKELLKINLKIIITTLKFDKCLYFVKNHLLFVLREILFTDYENVDEEIIFLSLDILDFLIKFFVNLDIFSSFYYFDRIDILFDMMSYYFEKEKYLYIILKLIVNYLDHNLKKIENLTTENKRILIKIIINRDKIQNIEIIEEVYKIKKLINLKNEEIEESYDYLKTKANLNNEEKMFLFRGLNLDFIKNKKLFKKSFIQYDFAKEKFDLIKKKYGKNEKNEKITIWIKNIKIIDQLNQDEINFMENSYKGFFNKNLKKDLYFNIKYENGEDNVEDVIFIFENVYKCTILKNLVKAMYESK